MNTEDALRGTYEFSLRYLERFVSLGTLAVDTGFVTH
jgi:hypothetical protein